MFAMVIESEIQSILDYDARIGLVYWLLTALSIAAIALGVGYVSALVRHRNPFKAASVTLGGMIGGIGEVLILFTPSGMKRTYSMAVLTFKEAIRRRILYVFVLFFVPFLFAGWYLPNSNEGQLIFLVAFVNNAITWLLLPLAAIMVSMSLPNDLKNRTIQTVVTKPVRRTEVVVGRIVGFMGIFTLLLLVMGGVGLVYLRSQVGAQVFDKQWTARVPVYASSPAEGLPPLLFVKNGVKQTQGTNVGKEWAYRSHIEGATSDTAHWYFRFDPDLFVHQPNVRSELTFDIFKTTKGDPTRPENEGSGVWCLMEFKNPKTGETAHSRTFRVDQLRVNELVDLPSSMFKDGQLEVVAQCLTANQFLGMAIHDIYFLVEERSFEANFIKGLASIWLKLFFLTCIAVSASTVLNGFVTFLLTVSIYTIGFFYGFLVAVIRGEIQGGGPIESFIRLVTMANQTVLLEPTWYNRLAASVDKGLLWLLEIVSRLIPDLTTLDTTQYVAEGFDIPIRLLFRDALIVIGYVVPAVLVGYYLFRNREIAA